MSQDSHNNPPATSGQGGVLPRRFYLPEKLTSGPIWVKGLIALCIVAVLVSLMILFIPEPEVFDVRAHAMQRAGQESGELVTGYVTTATLLGIGNILLDKRGGYLSNDRMPPWVFLDNIPSWEYGVLVQIRDLSRALRNDFSRAQSQSTEDPALAKADPQFNYNSNSWALPATEGEYRRGIDYLSDYLRRLSDPGQKNAQFFARTDSLEEWLGQSSKRLGSLSQRLRASTGQRRINTDLGNDPAAQQSTPVPSELSIRTSWATLDDVFYEARGSCWALIHFLQAVEIDFRQVLTKKNALVSLRQIIRELESTQDRVWSPIILNGTGFGFVANHSLVMASYISRANAGLIDLRNLLSDG